MISRNARIGQFDKSFLFRTLRDFFFSVVFIMAVVLAFSYWLTLQRFQDEGQQQTVYAAERLADDIRQIMLNKGGPVASRTVYPILRRNHERLGLAIAIQPSEVTVSSIEKRFDFTPQGLPPDWPENGRYQEHVVELKAESACLQCHTDAGVGDVLGKVTVRSYLSAFVKNWWQNARTNALVGLVEIVVGTLVVFFLLRSRMEPLLALRSVVSRMARGEMRLTERAPVRSEDEFGELAFDLNQLLERVCEVAEEMGELLSDDTVTDTDITDYVSAAQTELQDLRQSLRQAHRHCSPDPEERDESAAGLESALTREMLDPQADAELPKDHEKSVQDLLGRVQALMVRHEALARQLLQVSERADHLGGTLERLGQLAERLRGLVKAEHRLLRRLG